MFYTFQSNDLKTNANLLLFSTNRAIIEYMKRKTNRKINKFLIAFSAFALSLIGGLNVVFPAVAEEPNATSTPADGTDELIAPTSYEQYLNLTAPNDVAVNERYVAISDENVIYVYDSVDNLYREYTHENYKIAKMQFSDSGSLYFADETAKLYHK